MEKQLLEQFEKLNAHIEDSARKSKTNKVTDWAMRIATGVSTVGIIGVFSFFLTTMPTIQSRLERSEWQVDLLLEQLKEIKIFMKEPRFTENEYREYESIQNNSIAENKATLKSRDGWMDSKDSKDQDQDYRILTIEKKIEQLAEDK